MEPKLTEALRRNNIIALALAAFPICVDIASVHGQAFPAKPVRIVTSGIGGANDFTARLVAHGLTSAWGQQAIVENRGGTSPAISVLAVTKAAPDGYTLLSHGTPVWMQPFLQDHAPYDPVRDLSPITLVMSSPNVLVVHPSLPVKSVKELITLAKARPGALSYGTTTLGSPNHLSAELFKSMAQVNIVGVPYKGAAQSLQDLMSGRVEVAFPSAAAAIVHIKSGRLRALAMTSAQPSALFPTLPTIAASGLPGYEAVGKFVIFAPAGTPAAIIARLNQDIVKVINTPDVKEKFVTIGGEIAGSTPEATAAMIKSEMARMGKVIRDAGIRAE